MRRSLLALLTTFACLTALPSPALGMVSYKNPPPGANDFSCKPGAAHP